MPNDASAACLTAPPAPRHSATALRHLHDNVDCDVQEQPLRHRDPRVPGVVHCRRHAHDGPEDPPAGVAVVAHAPGQPRRHPRSCARRQARPDVEVGWNAVQHPDSRRSWAGRGGEAVPPDERPEHHNLDPSKRHLMAAGDAVRQA
eukprot:352186-Chlamydomonas_euryale.AAC.4